MEISFIIPVYNERDTLEPLVEGIAEHAAPHAYRIVFVDDGSTDGSTEVLADLAQRYASVEVVYFRCNCGKTTALTAGFARATGDLVFTMDADLQDDPKEIPRFIEKIEEGFDLVSGWKQKRHDPWHKTLPSRVYNRRVTRLFGLDIHDVNCGFKAMRTEVARNFRLYGERHRLLPVLAKNLGYRVGEIVVEHHARRYGVSKYGFERFYRGALDVTTTWFITRYGEKPLHFFGLLAFCSALIGDVAILAGIVAWLAKAWTCGYFLIGAGVLFLATALILFAIGLAAELLVHYLIQPDPEPYITD
jgi:glycosyltransferase involved in cell wall biosynthesis